MAKIYNKGEALFLYIKFDDVKKDSIIKDVKVRILHEKDENIYEDLEWTEMLALSKNEYYFNYIIPFDADCGLYDIIYNGDVDGKPASMIETFHVINKSEIYDDAIKIYGYIDDSMNNLPLSDVSIEITSNDDIYNTRSYSKENGYWETYLYPGEYTCYFKKQGFQELCINIQIGNENNEMQFNNITLESTQLKTCGDGAYKISDSYSLKNGIPLDGLEVKVFNIFNPTEQVAKDITNSKGVWTVFLDPGNYFLKVSGVSMNNEFDKTFRLNVKDDGKYVIEDMTENKAAIRSEYISNGEGSIKYTDRILDKYENPIVDVQVTAYQNDKIIAQSYSDITGKYELFLDAGEYMIDIYHPSFKEIAEFKITLSENITEK